jgi:hypothetical protein
MIDPIKSGAGVSDRSSDRKQDRRRGEGVYPSAPAESPAPGPAPGSDLRLVIERDAEGAYYIYRLIDRATGAVVAELPRDQVASLAEGQGYTAGTVVSTKA